MDGKECEAHTFADDTNLMIAREEESLRNCIKYIEKIKKVSGLDSYLGRFLYLDIQFFKGAVW